MLTLKKMDENGTWVLQPLLLWWLFHRAKYSYIMAQNSGTLPNEPQKLMIFRDILVHDD